ncbi:hypothetical protein A8B82_14515 [Sulfitobacter sp. EhC04]|uniref:hypothetical protein n=1 Tax=Sulfitobacter sp. EhC04 TaxID=1849168 RepID=UPI0007F4E4A3|nr:hypothetical protein [Sulfitobacter sp. EhC04]OAN76924.1 hypothetical protein A8B82_14515 [Sulfitobacter sp. EhC04]
MWHSTPALTEADRLMTVCNSCRYCEGLYKSTILRILESLLDAGYIMRVEDSKYALGPSIMNLGLAYERSNP